jgi:hypothetical protein
MQSRLGELTEAIALESDQEKFSVLVEEFNRPWTPTASSPTLPRRHPTQRTNWNIPDRFSREVSGNPANLHGAILVHTLQSGNSRLLHH